MIKYIKRKSDNKFLQSLEQEIWVDNAKDAFEMTLFECKKIKDNLLSSYQEDEIIEVVNFIKNKQLSKKEKKELKTLLKDINQD